MDSPRETSNCHDSQDFAGKVVVLTGGDGGLGGAVRNLLLARGAEVVLPVMGARAEGVDDHPRLRIVPSVDLTAEADVVRVYESADSLFASIHLVGGFRYGRLQEASVDDLDFLLNLNVRSAWLCCREASKHFAKGGRIVNVSAKPALTPSANLVTYAMTKAAVASLTQGLAEELAPEGVWVNAIAPSIIDTPANRKAMPNEDFSQWPTPEALAETIVFLASPQNRSTRGSVVPVYGKS